MVEKKDASSVPKLRTAHSPTDIFMDYVDYKN